MNCENIQDPKVTICVVTYNQEKYIAQCLQSLVSQETDFDFEVIVSDDCSTDRTREIIREFAVNYPTLVKPIFHKKNIGALESFSYAHNRAVGEYIAHMDGDDYALPGKLQRQSDVLDSMPEISLVGHPVRIVGSEQIIGSPELFPKIGNMYDLLKFGTYFVNSSTMYRCSNRVQYKESDQIVDFYRFIDLASCGNIYLCNEVYGEYRLHSEGISKKHEYFYLIQECYSRAYDRAIELGVDIETVEKARQQRKMKSAIGCLLLKRYAMFYDLIKISSVDYRYACFQHKILNLFKNRPFVLQVFVLLHKLKIKAVNSISKATDRADKTVIGPQ